MRVPAADGRILRLAVPALGQLCLEPLLSLADTSVAGHAADLSLLFHGGAGSAAATTAAAAAVAAPSVEAVAAIGINASVFNLVLYIAGFAATALAPAVARLRGGGREDDAAALAGLALRAALGVGAALALAMELCAPQILSLASGGGVEATGAAGAAAVAYLRVRALTIPLSIGGSVAAATLRGCLDTATPLKVAAAANAANLALDVVLVAADPAHAARDVSAATLVAELLSFSLFARALRAQAPPVRLLPRGAAGGEQLADAVEQGAAVLRSSLALFLRTTVLQLVLAVAAATAASGGATQAAAHQVLSQLFLLASFAFDALAVAASALVADGRGRMELPPGAPPEGEAADAAARCLAWGVGTGSAAAALALLTPLGAALPQLLSSSAEVANLAAPILPALLLTLPLSAVAFVGDGIFNGSEAFAAQLGAMVLAAAAYAAALEGALGVGGAGLGTLEGVWAALLALQAARVAGFLVWFWRQPSPPPAPGEPHKKL